MPSGLPAAYLPLIAPASAVAEGLNKPLGVFRSPLLLGILPDTEYGMLMSGRPQKALVSR